MENPTEEEQKLLKILDSDEIVPPVSDTGEELKALPEEIQDAVKKFNETDLTALAEQQKRIAEHNAAVRKKRAEKQARKAARRQTVGDHRKPGKRRNQRV